VLKICDMGQSRILPGSASVAQTGSRGGTLGWMSPEELAPQLSEIFESRRTGDIHPAGSLMFYLLTRGVHAFGGSWMEQQTNISAGLAVNLLPELRGNRDACDLFVRMTHVEPKARLTIEEVRRHPALWDAETKLKNVCDWSKSWEHAYACQTSRSAGAPAEDIAQTIATRAALQQKLDRHAAAVGGMLGDSAEGWLAKLDEPVRRWLLAHRHYDGREITHLLQAVRTIHRFL
jgi:serine/threonine protein kinase